MISRTEQRLRDLERLRQTAADAFRVFQRRMSALSRERTDALAAAMEERDARRREKTRKKLGI